MNLRTPRRRISPRTRRRYRAIREFFRRALGSSSQPDIKISSSIAVNVTDLKRKIVGLEQQLDEVNKHCQNITSLDCTRRESESLLQLDDKESICRIPLEVNPEQDRITEHTEPSYKRNSNGSETKFLYKSCNGQYGKSQATDNHLKTQYVKDASGTQRMFDDYEEHISETKNQKHNLHRYSDYGAKLHKCRARSVYENLASANSTNSFRSLINPRMRNSSTGNSGHPNDKKYLKEEYAEPIPPQYHKEKKCTERSKRRKNDKYKESSEQKPIKIRKQKHHSRELDSDFIADIIKRQYRPVKMFGRKGSDLSQISAPVCRDQEFSIREDLLEGAELCSCGYDRKNHKKTHRDLNEMRSICDTRLYSNKGHHRPKRYRAHREIFRDKSNSDVYDFIPVKEKSSPKTRRKFAKDNMLSYEYCREVPPSPRTLRPQLNLKSQYNSEFEGYMAHVKHSRNSSPYNRRRQRERVQIESDGTSVQVPNYIIEQPRKSHKRMPCHVEKQVHCKQDNGTMSSLQYLPYSNDQVTVDTTLNKTEETREEIPVDKTDKALCEIKDILQSFLQEIKKETAASQCEKFEESSKTGDNGMSNENNAKLNDTMPNSRHSFNNFGIGYGASPYMSSFQNPCCYPIMPVCPMNYPNGYIMPSASFTCANCVVAAKESAHNEHCCHKNTTTTCHDTETCHTETENLIKEIYKFVAQGSVRKKECESCIGRHEGRKPENKILTTRGVGESYRLSKHDAKVGTPPLKCYSKSCEAIGSRISSDVYNGGTNASYSDTILEKLSLQVTQSTSDTEMDTTTSQDRSKRNKFSTVLRSIGLLKKKRKDVIEELSESAIDVEINQRSPRSPRSPRAPYRQDIINYMMPEQEYYHQPPVTSIYRRPTEYQPDYNPPYNPGLLDYSQPPPAHDMYAPQAHHLRAQQATAPPYPSKQRPTAPPFHPTYDHPYKQQPQVPLCLREIEVKSIGTQSERKMSIFRKIKKKIQPPDVETNQYIQNNCSTQTQTAPGKPPLPNILAKPLSNWKKLQAKAMADYEMRNMDPMKFSVKTGQELAEGDVKLRNVLLKKLLHKRNPFSPGNLIVRTLLGRDKSSFGEPPMLNHRPRMFV